MLKNILLTAWRNLKKRKGYAFINIAGLAAGMASCLLILLYVLDELSYDRFHQQAAQIYRVVTDGRLGDREIAASLTAAPIGDALATNFPEVRAATRLFASQFVGQVSVRHGDKSFNEDRFFFADSTFFDVFTFPLIDGNPHTALSEPNTVVITETIARKYFGDENPISKTLTVNKSGDYRISGVVRDIPSHSHFHFDFLASMASLHISKDPRWAGNISFHTYIVLQEKYPAASLDAKFPELVKNNLGPQLQAGLGISYEQMVAAGGRYRLSLQPLTDIHLRSHLEFEIEPNSNIAYVYIFSAIAVLILLIACINFMNLATARSAHRAKEVGVRKVLGSNRVQLVSQFLSESMLLTFVALLFALALVELLLPVFNQLSGKQIETNYFGSGILLPSLIGLALLLGMMAGSYPAFFLASFQPLAVIRGKPGAALPGAKKFRSSLVVFQFTISIALIVATIVVHDQWVTPEIKIWASTRSM